ncbi:hypothetical protein BD413DRAFT_649850, partial [Trametes elegans]
KVAGILEGLTSANLVAVADRLVGLINSSREGDGWTLRLVAQMISLTAAKRDALAEHLARLCCRLAEQTSADVSDVEVPGAQGVPVTGGRLFRHYLLDGCQHEFDLRLMAHGILAGRPRRACTPQECDGSAERRGGVSGSGLDAYGSAAAQDARRCGRGIISFLAELFKMGILPTRMLAACVHALLSPTQGGRGVLERPCARSEVVCNMKGVEDSCTLLEALGALLDAGPVEGRAIVDGCIADITRYTMGRQLGVWRMRAMLGPAGPHRTP